MDGARTGLRPRPVRRGKNRAMESRARGEKKRKGRIRRWKYTLQRIDAYDAEIQGKRGTGTDYLFPAVVERR